MGFVMKKKENERKLNGDGVFEASWNVLFWSLTSWFLWDLIFLQCSSLQRHCSLWWSQVEAFLNYVSASFTRIVFTQEVVIRQHACTPTHTRMYTHTHACSPTHTLYKVTDIKQREWHMLHAPRADLNCIWTRVPEECHHLIHKAWTVCTELLVLETWPPVGLYFHEKNKINIAVKDRL